MTAIDDTHVPERKSWVESANDASTDFPIQNLPFGVYRRTGSSDAFRVGVAIGDDVADVAACAEIGAFSGDAAAAAARCAEPCLNSLMAMGRGPLRALRTALVEFFSTNPAPTDRARALLPMRD